MSSRFQGRCLSDTAVLSQATALARSERSHQADLLVRIAEIDHRRLYLPAGYPTMSAYCVGELGFSEDKAGKRIQAARTALRFPVLFEALDDGRLELTAIRLLAPHLTEENVDELVAKAAACHRMSDIQVLLAQRFAEPDLLSEADFRVVNSHAPGHASAPVESGEWVHLRIRVRKDKLAYARDLLSHSLPSGDACVVFDRALDALIEKAEKKKFAACTSPRAPRPRTVQDRCIPAQVRRAVWERDGGQCTFVSEKGRRCSSRRLLEYDHIRPVARGGKASIEGIRLRCRGHNQYEAERVFGGEFMRKKRQEARGRRQAERRIRPESEVHEGTFGADREAGCYDADGRSPESEWSSRRRVRARRATDSEDSFSPIESHMRPARGPS